MKERNKKNEVEKKKNQKRIYSVRYPESSALELELQDGEVVMLKRVEVMDLDACRGFGTNCEDVRGAVEGDGIGRFCLGLRVEVEVGYRWRALC